MTELDDHQLLGEYVRTASETAFAALVARYVNLVYSAGLRFTGNPHHAEEITQAVFIILARKAGSLRRGAVLSGWLYQTARLTAANFVKSEIRRQNREQEVFMQSTLNESEAAAWEQIASLLDEAMGQLGPADRDALVLRFFENKTSQEVAATLKLNEVSARKRVSRAVEKLRKFFTKRGVALSATAIAGAVSANSVQAAPAALAHSVTVIAITKGAMAGGSTLTLVKGALKIMAWTKAKSAVVAGVVLILAAGTTTVMVRTVGHHSRASFQPSTGDVATFQRESIVRMNQAKQWALACIMFADDNRNQFPTGTKQLQRYAPGLSDANWELVSGGDYSKIARPATAILLREKESRQSPDGRFYKSYAFCDGHAELVASTDNDFEALEKQRGFLVHPVKN